MPQGSMTYGLLIAEKPDLMRKIEAVYKKYESGIPYKIDFTSQRGHLVTLKTPDEIDESQKKWAWENLPFHPEQHGGWQYKVIQERKQGNFLTAKERYDGIVKQLKSGKYDFVINAGDPDQEGELLIRLVLSYAKNALPVKRFWTNDLTEKCILDALKGLRDDDTDPMLVHLLDAAYGRQHSDYRFGMNISRAATLKMNGRVACGRVKTPILAIVCQREDEIANFKPKTTYGVKAVYQEGFDGVLFDSGKAKEEGSADPDDEKDNAEEEKSAGIVKFETKEEALKLISSLGKHGSVISAVRKRTETYAPKLFKLATLQVEAGKYGINDAKALATLQTLYEKEYLSYPRTDCEFLSSQEDFFGILKAVMAVPELNPYIRTISKQAIEKVRHTKKWINDQKLKESGHSALRPTTKAVPEFDKLTHEEQVIYTLVCKRFVAMFLPPLVQDKAVIVTDIDGKTFRSTGKILVDPGFSKIFGTQFNDSVLPELKEKDEVNVDRYETTQSTTVCPRHYTSPEIIAACENPAKFLNNEKRKELGKRLKIGTPATRSSIIQTLIKTDKYLEEKKEGKTVYILPTQTGKSIISNLGSCDICKVDLTGEWEEKLELVREGKLSLQELENGMMKHVESLIEDIRNKNMGKIESAAKKRVAVIGVCPKCGKQLCEGEKGFFCMGFRDNPKCGVGMYKELLSAHITTVDFLNLMAGKTIVKDLTKDSKRWKQALKYNMETCKCDFVDTDDEGNDVNLTDILCPLCKKPLRKYSWGYRCSDERPDGCSFKLFSKIAGKYLSNETIKKLVKEGKAGPVSGFKSKAGKSFSACLVLRKKEENGVVTADVAFEFPQDKEAQGQPELYALCPDCKVKMVNGPRRWECQNKCGISVPYTLAERKITGEEAEALLRNRHLGPLSGFYSKSGKPFTADLIFEGKELKFQFPERR